MEVVEKDVKPAEAEQNMTSIQRRASIHHLFVLSALSSAPTDFWTPFFSGRGLVILFQYELNVVGTEVC